MGSVMTVTSPAPWSLQTRLELAAQPTVPGVVRGHVRAMAGEWGLAGLAETAELLASELATNAVQASQRLRVRAELAIVPVVRLWLTSDGASIVIHIWDASSEMPVRQDTMAGEEGGRGLLLVDALAKDWGTYRKSDGKVVWAMITSADL
jgi:anti-sigma regulatory factor (Ser/Thr protein kinase)